MLARRTVHGWLPLALVAALALVGVVAARSLPDPMATHFGPGGVPDGTMPRLLGLAVAPILAAVAAGFLVGVTRWGRRVNDAWALAGLAYLLLGAAWGLQLGLVASNSGASRASDARLAGTGWLALIVPFAAFGIWSALRCKRLEPVSSASWANVDVAAVGDDIVITMRGADAVGRSSAASACRGAASCARRSPTCRRCGRPGFDCPAPRSPASCGPGRTAGPPTATSGTSARDRRYWSSPWPTACGTGASWFSHVTSTRPWRRCHRPSRSDVTARRHRPGDALELRRRRGQTRSVLP